MEILKLENVKYIYQGAEEQTGALDNISLSVNKGEFVCILGHNGSGKSTLAKLINGLYQPTEGKVYVKGMDTSDESQILNIRKTAGMVFQNPDNQLVATIVEEDVAFGPENLGVPTPEIRTRVDNALAAVGMEQFVKSEAHRLSGGQKQRIAIAGVLAMEPEIMVLDEPTAMLDPRGRAEVMETVTKLNKEKGITIIHITHFMEEAINADRLIVLADGQIKLQGKPREVFTQVDELRKLALDVPGMTYLAYLLRKNGFEIPADILTVKEMAEALCPLL